MAITYTNNFNNIMDKLMEIVKAEMRIPVQKTSLEQPLLKAKESAEFDMFVDNLASKNGITIY